MADPQPPPAPAAATADLESKEIWGDEADQLDEEIMKVHSLAECLAPLLWLVCYSSGCVDLQDDGDRLSRRRAIRGTKCRACCSRV